MENKTEHKIVQYLSEAHAMEKTLATMLQSQIAMTPRGSYREGLETHLRETREHAKRVHRRLDELGQGNGPLHLGVGILQSVVGQAFALGKTPFDLVRGNAGEEKVLKNAKDACAAEALEIATYTAIEHLAETVGDETTRSLAKSILAEEQKMLDRILKEIPKLTRAVVGADIRGNSTYDARKTGKGALATEGDLAISGYGRLTVAEIVEKLPRLSQVDLAKIDSYERSHKNRTGVIDAAERELVKA